MSIGTSGCLEGIVQVVLKKFKERWLGDIDVQSIKMMEFQRANLVQLFSNQPEDDCGIIWGCSSFIIESISDEAAGATFHCYFIRFLESSRASLILRYEVGKGLGAVYLNLEREREGEL